ncbi:hypothetical protein N7453_004225 [Penicillium expansum]|nr:hypothetical protein N7453_004225 [Penicillium expansum]
MNFMHELMIIRHLSSDHAHLNYFKSPRQLRHGLSFRKSCRSCRSCQIAGAKTLNLAVAVLSPTI